VKKYWKIDLFLVGCSQFLSMAAFSAAYTFIPFYLKEIGVSSDRLSWYVAVFGAVSNLSFAASAPFWGAMADRFGRKLMLIRANFGGAVLMPIMGLITNPDLLIAHRILLGLMTGTVTASQTLILSTTPQEKRTFALGALASALFSGLMVGQFTGGEMVNRIGFQWTFVICGILLGTAGLLAIAVHEHFVPVKPDRKAPGKSGTWRFGAVWYLLILFVCVTLARDMDNLFIPVLVDEIMQDQAAALRWSGYVFGSCSAVAILMGSLVGWIADRTKVLTVLLVTTVLAGLLRIPQLFADSVIVFLIARCCMVAASCGIEPLMQSWLAGVTPETEHGRFFGIAGTFKGVGWAAGSMLGGGVIMLCGNQVRSVFAVPLVLMLLLVPVILWVAGKLPPPAHRKKRR